MKKLSAVFLLFPVFVFATTIYDVQYTDYPGDGTYPSPMDGQTVTVSGIVTAVKSGTYKNFYLEERPGGAWHGVYVFDSSVKPELGDSVTITAEVTEYYGLTELKNVSSHTIHSSGNPLPSPSEINTGTIGDGGFEAEKYEGVLVVVTNVEVTQTVDGYGQWYVSDGSGECQIEDDMYHYEPNIGETFAAILGMGSYGYGEYEIHPRDESDLIKSASGTGKATISPDFVFTSSNTSHTIKLEDPFDTLNHITIKIPYQWYFNGDTSSITLLGEAFQGATCEVTGNGSVSSPWVIDIMGASLFDSASVKIDSLRSPDEAGNYGFTVSTAVSGEEPLPIISQPSVRVLTRSGTGEVKLNPIRIFKGETLGIRMEVKTTYDIELNKICIEIPSMWSWTGDTLDVKFRPEQENVSLYAEEDSIFIDNLQVIDSLFIYIDNLTSPSLLGSFDFYVYTASGEEPVFPIQIQPFITIIDSVDIIKIGDVQTPGEDGYTSHLLGENVNIRGFVTSPSLGDYTSFYLQDETGGVNIFSYDPLSVNVGQEWIIPGEVEEYNGLTEVKITAIEDCILMSDSTTDEQIDSMALVLAPSQGLTEIIEGRLIMINNTKIQTLPYEVPDNFQVWNAKTLIDVRIQDGTGIEVPIAGMELGDYYDIIGIAGQYDREEPYTSGYQLLPRSTDDLIKVSVGEPSEKITVKIYPNPFSPDLGECLYIELNSPQDSRITVRVFDLKGRLIKTVLSNLTGGPNYTDWDGTDENEEGVPIGIYLLHIQSVKDGETESIVKPVVVGTPLER